MGENFLGKLGIGPLSSEIIEAVFRYSEKRRVPLMLIASQNQIDWDGGYVNGWKTNEYMAYVGEMRQKYTRAKVSICRDHCGPGFKSDTLSDVYKTIDCDIENGFDLIHVDFCHYKGNHQAVIDQSRKAIEYIHRKSPKTLIEVGTDENSGGFLTDASRVEEEIKVFTALGPICFFVVQTGSLIKEMNQVGTFNEAFLKEVRSLVKGHDIRFKEHNGDYLSEEDIAMRTGLIDAVNVAPQYGVLQTMLTLEKAFLYGIDPTEFLNDAYVSNKWKRWLHTNTKENRLLCSLIAGHYVFSGDAYRKLFEKIGQHENIREVIIGELMKNFSMYTENL